LKEFAVKVKKGMCLEVWDVQSQKLDVRIEEHDVCNDRTVYMRSTYRVFWYSLVFWTNNNKTIKYMCFSF